MQLSPLLSIRIWLFDCLSFIKSFIASRFCFPDLKGYKCECGRTFHTYTDLLYHKHPSDEDEETIVTVAPIVTSKSAPRIPESEFPVPEFIEKGFEPKHPLKVYTDVRLNPYICQYCSKSYPNSR